VQILIGVVEEVKTNKKFYGKRGSEMHPWGVMGKIIFLGLAEEKNS